MKAKRCAAAAVLFTAVLAGNGIGSSPAMAQETVKADASAPKELPKAGPDGWITLWDGKSLTNWKTTDFFKPG